MNPLLNGYTFYVHNLGRFDSIFIIKSLVVNKNITITPIWKDNAILSLTIKYNDFKIILLDSLQLISGSLENILISFNCSIKKGHFPYKAVSKKSLFYIGNKPLKKFYENNISDQEYLSIPNTNWSLKNETLKYLKSDVEGLLEVVTKFKDSIFDKYSLDITKFKTLPGLVLAVYTSSYIPDNLKSEIKMIKGELEKEIRGSYFGGNVDIFINKMDKGYYYDINYQYSTAMLNDMPVGEPLLSLETDLNKIFGFVYGEITCPDENVLQVPFIQYKDPLLKFNNCPRGKFKRLIFSEEIKYAIKYGYKINIEYCYQFKRGKDLFTNYVNDHYEIKSSTKDPVQKAIAKLFLNSLYGRLGMKEIEDRMEIVDKNEAEFLDKNTNVSIISELGNDRYLIKYSGKINDNIRSLYSKDPLISNKNKKFNKDEMKNSGLNKARNIPSAVHIAAAISSYARIIINDYKNIPGNPCIMSDTDSVVLTYPLPNHLVGNGLGQMKLEQEVFKGIFLRKKFYCIINSNNQEIIKASGLDSSKLSYDSFKRLLNGESIEIERMSFNVE
jgi:DNA polymerase type B, organellar and viral